jgi:hypothetical protein
MMTPLSVPSRDERLGFRRHGVGGDRETGYGLMGLIRQSAGSAEDTTLTRDKAKQMAESIATEVRAVKGSAFIGTWLNVPGISLEISLDTRSMGRRYVIHHVIGEKGCTVKLIEGDGRPGRGPFHSEEIGATSFDVASLVSVIGSDMGQRK